MFEIGWTEMLVIAIVMIVVVGPKDLPKMLRTFGKFTSKMTSMAGDFRKQFDEALKEAELDDVRKSVDELRALNPKNEIRKALNPMEKAAADVRAGMDSLMRPKTSVPTPTASTEATASEPLKTGPVAEPGSMTAGAATELPAPTSSPSPAVEPVAPLAAATTVAASAPPIVGATSAVAASPIEPAKKPRAPRAPKAVSADGPVSEAPLKAKSTSKPATTKLVDATATVNGVAAPKPVRSRKPKETGTAT